MFAAAPVVTFRSSIAALRLKLWDSENGALVPFPKRGSLDAARSPAA